MYKFVGICRNFQPYLFADEPSDDKSEVDENDQIKGIFKGHGGRFGKMGLRVTKLLNHVELLIQYQEQQRRLRNHTLMDSPEATKIMKKYRARKAKTKKFTVVTTNNSDSSNIIPKLILNRHYDKPVHSLQKTDSELKIKLVKKTIQKVEVAEIIDEVTTIQTQKLGKRY